MSVVKAAIAFVVLGMSIAACGGSSDATPTTPVDDTRVLATLTVTLANSQLEVGGTTAATAAGLDQKGSAITLGAVTWSTGSAAVATVNNAGTITAVAAGTTSVTATSVGKQASASITVNALPVSGITITPPTTALLAGGSLRLTATTRDRNGAVLTGRRIAWSSSAQTIATIDSTGLARGIAFGATTITATSEGVTALVALSVGAASIVGTYRMAFARGTSCQREDPWSCDLYFADINLGTKSPVAATRIAADTGVAEWFPTLSSSGRWVLYNRGRRDPRGKINNDIYGIDLNTPGAVPVPVVTGGRFPSLSPDDRHLYFARDTLGRIDLFHADISFNTTTGAIQASNVTQITTSSLDNPTDPFPVGNTGGVSFHYATGADAFAVAVLNPATGQVTPVASTADHSSVNTAGTMIAYGISAGTAVGIASATNGVWSQKQRITVPVTGAALAAFDADYSAQPLANWFYTEWVDDGHLVSSVQGGSFVGASRFYAMCRLFLLTTASGTTEPLGPLLGVPAHQDYCTVAVRFLR